MSGGSEERDRLREEIIEELKKKMHEVRAIIDPSGEKVKLIGVVGRFARGDWHPGSDIDVILVCEGVSGPHWKRLDLPPVIIRRHSVEYHVLSLEEFKLLCEEARMTAYDLFNEGIIIHADKQYLDGVRRMFDEAAERMRVAKKEAS